VTHLEDRMNLSYSQRRKMHEALDEVIDEANACMRLSTPPSASWPDTAHRGDLERMSARISKLEDAVATMAAEARHDRFKRSQTILMLAGLTSTMAVYAAIQYWLR
jgi:hypothetical protein